MLKRKLPCILLALAGCVPAGDDTPQESTTSAPATTVAGDTTTTSEPAKKVLHASFVAEKQAGDAPALLRLFNDTPDQILSLTLDDGQSYTFYLIEPLAVSDYEITTSDDMWTDAILSIHTTDSCVRKPFAEMTGPLALEPGHAYGIHVTIEEGFAAAIEEEGSPEPYIGIRAHVADPAGSSTPAPSKLTLSVAGSSPGEVVFETIFTEYPEPYVRVPGSKVELEKIHFVDRAGLAHETSSPVVLEGSHGYTIYVDDEVRDGAEIDVPLDTLVD